MQLYRNYLRPLFFQLGPEAAHHAAMLGLGATMGSRLVRRTTHGLLSLEHPMLRQQLWGLPFTHPVGLAAGFDKNAEAIEEIAALGFGHVEIGTVTARAQPGNPQPRCFRLPHDKSLINRMGFNNHGAEAAAAALAARYDPAGVGEQRRPSCILGVNIGRSTSCPVEETLQDHLHSLEKLAPFADYLVVNVSCPNVKGVTGLQAADSLRPLLEGVRSRLRELAPHVPMLVKLGPDLDQTRIASSVDVILGCGCDGILATNTSALRQGLRTAPRRVQLYGRGGLSGAAIRGLSTQVLARIARQVDGRVPLIGIGGIDGAEAAWEKIVHGASLLQVYTGFIYSGPTVVRDICRGLIVRLRRHGLKHISEAVGRAL